MKHILEYIVGKQQLTNTHNIKLIKIHVCPSQLTQDISGRNVNLTILQLNIIDCFSVVISHAVTNRFVCLGWKG